MAKSIPTATQAMQRAIVAAHDAWLNLSIATTYIGYVPDYADVLRSLPLAAAEDFCEQLAKAFGAFTSRAIDRGDLLIEQAQQNKLLNQLRDSDKGPPVALKLVGSALWHAPGSDQECNWGAPAEAKCGKAGPLLILATVPYTCPDCIALDAPPADPPKSPA